MSTTTEPVSLSAAEKGYVKPEVLVTTDWLAAAPQRREDPHHRERRGRAAVRHRATFPNAQKIDWHADLNDPVVRDYVSTEQFQELLRSNGIDEITTVVFYGDKNNWWATYAFWVFQLFGFTNAKVLDGGRDEVGAGGPADRDRRADVPARRNYVAPERDDSTIRAFKDEVLAHSKREAGRSSTCARPTSSAARRRTCRSIRRKACCAADTFPARRACRGRARRTRTARSRRPTSCATIYEGEAGLKKSDDVVAYCRIGERSSHTWFVLTYLLGYDKVRNYDGSWTEWGNSVRLPVEK